MNMRTRILKRIFDLTASIFSLVILSPIWLAVVLTIMLKDGLPIFYRQQRVGKDGRRFHLVKFRTMVRNADKLSRLTPTVDPRITSTGRFLRKYHLDEIPQLWNIVRGDMSIVGPRPEVPEFVDLKDPRWQKTLSVRPGLTYDGTLHFRRQGDDLQRHTDYVRFYKEELLPVKLSYAVRYADEATFLGDLKVILATINDILRPDSSKEKKTDIGDNEK